MLFYHGIHITASFGLLRIKNPWCRISIATCHTRSTHDVYPESHARNALQQSSAGLHMQHIKYDHNHSWKVFGYFRGNEIPIKFTIIPILCHQPNSSIRSIQNSCCQHIEVTSPRKTNPVNQSYEVVWFYQRFRASGCFFPLHLKIFFQMVDVNEMLQTMTYQ